MALEKERLDNGLTLYVDRIAASVDNTVTMYVPFGSVNEKQGEEGLAHIIEHCVHLKTDDFESQQKLDRFAETNGMYANASTGYTSTQYFVNGLEIEPNIHYLSQILQHTHLPEDMIEDEMRVIRREAKMGLDDPEELHAISALNAMSGHPYGRSIIGHHDKLDFGADEISRLYKTHYKLGNFALIVTGSARIDEVARLAEEYFVADSEEYTDDTDELEQRDGELFRTGYVLEDANNVQVTVGYSMTPEFKEKYQKDRLLYGIAASVISDAAFRSLRQEKGISYNGGVGFSTFNHPNAWSIDGDVDTDAEHVALAEEVFNEIFSRDSSKYDDDEIKGALAMQRYGLLKVTSTAEGRSEMHLGRLRSYGEPIDVTVTKRRLMKVTEADVRACIDDIVEYTSSVPRRVHLTGTREAIGDVERIVEQSEIV